MDSEGRTIEVVLGTAFSDYDRRMGDNKTRPKNWCRQFARKVSVYYSLCRLATANGSTSGTDGGGALVVSGAGGGV